MYTWKCSIKSQMQNLNILYVNVWRASENSYFTHYNPYKTKVWQRILQCSGIQCDNIVNFYQVEHHSETCIRWNTTLRLVLGGTPLWDLYQVKYHSGTCIRWNITLRLVLGGTPLWDLWNTTLELVSGEIPLWDLYQVKYHSGTCIR